MKTVSCWDEIRPCGIDALTGEACSLGYRLLCDLTARGRAIVERCLGVKIQSENWNGGSKDDPHVASSVVAIVMWRHLHFGRGFGTGFRAVRHITWSYRVRRNSISPLSSRQCCRAPPSPSTTSHCGQCFRLHLQVGLRINVSGVE